MKIESYGYKFLITAMGGQAIKGKTFVATSNPEAFKHFCDILESGLPVGILLYKHGEILGSASLSVDEYEDLGSKEAWRYVMKYCEASSVNK